MKKIILLFMLLPLIIFSQANENRISYGIFGGFGLNFHTADFKKIHDFPSCSPGYKDGNGTGLSMGLVFDYQLGSDMFLSNKLLYKDLNGKLISLEKTTIIVNNIPTEGEFEHSLDATVTVIGIEPSIKYNLWKNLNLNIGVIASFLLSKDYLQSEKITKPSDYGTFLNPDGSDSKLRERNKFTGTLQEANPLYLAPMVSLTYKMPLDKNSELFLEPEIMYHYGITNIVKHDLVNKWSVNSLTFGISIKYSPYEKIIKKEKYLEEMRIDTIMIENDILAKNEYRTGKEFFDSQISSTDTEIITTKYTNRTDTIFIKKDYELSGSITAVGVDKNGDEIPNPKITVEEFISNRLDPLLNYIFFDENSFQILSRYKILNQVEKEKFEIESLYLESTLDIYYNILNIIGKRLTDNPNAKITIIGCNSDLGDEKGNISLSEKRAEMIKDYLVNIWNINLARIKTEKRNLPSKPSTPKDDSDKIAENRRVEIYSDNAKILEPIFIEKIDRRASPAIIRFKPTAISEAGLKKWEISAYQKTQSLYKFSNIGGEKLISQLDWEFGKYQKTIPKYSEPIIFSLMLEDIKDNSKLIENQTLNVDVLTIQKKRTENIGDFEIERFSLILFDFDKSTIDGNNKKITDFISSRIKAESEVGISGYTDRTGDADYNKKLSAKRAEATKISLKLPNAISNGIGEDELLYNNDIPEGRFYCRTVNVIVKTKVK